VIDSREIDGKSYRAYVKEKEEAKKTYDDAVQHGLAAAHVAYRYFSSYDLVNSQQARGSSHFPFQRQRIEFVRRERQRRTSEESNLQLNLRGAS